MKLHHHWLGCVTMVLLIIGGLNWGLVGLFHFNLVHFIFGSVPFLERLVYVIVGLCAIIWIVASIAFCKHKCDVEEKNTTTRTPL